jgi:hypothetical protein
VPERKPEICRNTDSSFKITGIFPGYEYFIHRVSISFRKMPGNGPVSQVSVGSSLIKLDCRGGYLYLSIVAKF